MIKRFCFIQSFISLVASMSAEEILVSSAFQINSQNWLSGDTLVFANGTYIDQQIVFRGSGRAGQPVVLKAQTPGEVVFSGNSRLELEGEFLSVTGFRWEDGYSDAGKAVVSFRANGRDARYCSLIDSRIKSYNPADLTIDYKWVSLYGEGNRVENCSFIDKRNSGTLLVVWVNPSIENNHKILNNYFGPRKALLDEYGNAINGQEIVRIGTSDVSMNKSATLVENNLFEQCDGETEIISNKSCGNIYRNNLFLECSGTLTLRHGNDCLVDGNYFIGNGKPLTGGIRIIGENHQVYNNYLENLTGVGYRSAICTVKGVAESPLNGYFQVKNLLVACNTIVDCKRAFEIDYGSGNQTLSAESVIMALNVVHNMTSSFMILNSSSDLKNITFEKNLYDYGVNGVNFIQAPLLMTTCEQKIQIPREESIVYKTTSLGYTQIKEDIRGNIRDSNRCAGALQSLNAPVRIKPDHKNTGVSWVLSSPPTGTSNGGEKKNILNFHQGKMQVVLPEEALLPAFLTCFDLYGRILHRFKLLSAESSLDYATLNLDRLTVNFVLSDRNNSILDTLRIII